MFIRKNLRCAFPAAGRSTRVRAMWWAGRWRGHRGWAVVAYPCAYTLPPRGGSGDETVRFLPGQPRIGKHPFSAAFPQSPEFDEKRGSSRYPTLLRDEALPAEAQPASRGFFGALGYIGQLRRTYLVCEGPSELVLVDQHAAHERIMFERLRVAQSPASRWSPAPALPHSHRGWTRLRLRRRAKRRRWKRWPDWASRSRALGRAPYFCAQCPDLLKDVDPKPLLRDVLHRWQKGILCAWPRELRAGVRHHGCHGALRAGDIVAREAAVTLLGQLDAVDLHSHCPHGRPVLLRMSIAEIEQRWDGRSYLFHTESTEDTEIG